MLVVTLMTSAVIVRQATSISQIEDAKVENLMNNPYVKTVMIQQNFNFYGLSACNCSALAVSEECEPVTGACFCQDGARGLKCDDCEYGYIGTLYEYMVYKRCICRGWLLDAGQVPDCERCQECFFNWDDIINDLRWRIANLHSHTIFLTQIYFSNYSVDEIFLETNLLLVDLQEANETLNTINLQESSPEELQRNILNVSLLTIIS